jgi:hypothetical protein
MSSVFLRREFGVQVWATDLWFSAANNLQRARDADVDDGVFRSTQMRGRCRSQRSSSTRLCLSIRSSTTGRMPCI